MAWLPACFTGAQMPQVPQMALQSCRLVAPPIGAVPQIAEFKPETALKPQIKAVHTGISTLTAALFIVDRTIGVERTIGLISDDGKFFMRFAFVFFMRFAFLLILVYNDGAGLIGGSTGAPDHVGAPNHI